MLGGLDSISWMTLNCATIPRWPLFKRFSILCKLMIVGAPGWSLHSVWVWSFWLKLIYNSWKSIMIGPSVWIHLAPRTVWKLHNLMENMWFLRWKSPIWSLLFSQHPSHFMFLPSTIRTWKIYIVLTKQWIASSTPLWIKLFVLSLSINTNTSRCLIKPQIWRVWGEEISSRAWSDITKLSGIAEISVSRAIFGSPSSTSGTLVDGASSTELFSLASIWNNFGSLNLCLREYLSSQ